MKKLKNIFSKSLFISILSIVFIKNFVYADLIAPVSRQSTSIISASSISSSNSSIALYSLVIIGVVATIYFCINAKK